MKDLCMRVNLVEVPLERWRQPLNCFLPMRCAQNNSNWNFLSENPWEPNKMFYTSLVLYISGHVKIKTANQNRHSRKGNERKSLSGRLPEMKIFANFRTAKGDAKAIRKASLHDIAHRMLSLDVE